MVIANISVVNLVIRFKLKVTYSVCCVVMPPIVMCELLTLAACFLFEMTTRLSNAGTFTCCVPP